MQRRGPVHPTPISDLSVVGILVGAALHFALGAIWYSPPLFAKPWARALGIEMGGGGGPSLAGPLAVNALGAIVSTAVIGVVYLWGRGNGVADGIAVGLLVGTGIVAVENLNRPMYERAPWVLYFINSGFAVVGFALAGLGYALFA
ncbi:MAG: DUF1761 domain-containing protein [Dehalococcoidia bacterium]|nr:MAG: DUF1761 domain-containing protein [Dehalococcoidia bacterium]